MQAYSPSSQTRLSCGNTYSNPPSTISNNNHSNNIPIQRSKSISSPTTPENVSYKHRTLQLSSSFDNTRLSSAFVPIVPNNRLYDW